MAKHNYNDDVGKALRAARIELGLSQTDAAARTGLTQNVVSYYENGKRTPTVNTLAAFSQAYGKDWNSFMPSDLQIQQAKQVLRGGESNADQDGEDQEEG
jgi:transcriptional regulator with XRE-family HTH domain